jgi:hypothetical protein
VISDLSSVAASVVELIKAQELEKARQLVLNRHRAALGSHFEARQQGVHELTLAIVEAKKQRSRVMQAVDGLPAEQQLLARVQVEAMCRDLFDGEIASLTSRKRQLSRPGGSV